MSSPTPNVEIKVLFFAKAREILDHSEVTIQVSRTPLNKSGVFNLLETTFPGLKVLNRSFALALNEEYLDDETLENEVSFENKDELAVIPPISGG